MTNRDLTLERKDQQNETPQIGSIMLTPPIDEDYWLFRVRLSETQAVVAFPKFGTIGVGFAQEEDWNTNLPYTCEAKEIFDHIAHNKGDDAIADEDCLAAIAMVQGAALESRTPPAEPKPKPITYLLYSLRHNAYWMPSSAGYTDDVTLAGRYSEAEAVQKVVASAHCGIRTQVTCMVAAPDNWKSVA